MCVVISLSYFLYLCKNILNYFFLLRNCVLQAIVYLCIYLKLKIYRCPPIPTLLEQVYILYGSQFESIYNPCSLHPVLHRPGNEVYWNGREASLNTQHGKVIREDTSQYVCKGESRDLEHKSYDRHTIYSTYHMS